MQLLVKDRDKKHMAYCLASAAILIIGILAMSGLLYLGYDKKAEVPIENQTRQEEERTVENVIGDLTAPASYEEQIPDGTIESLTAPDVKPSGKKKTEQNPDEEVIENLTAPSSE